MNVSLTEVIRQALLAYERMLEEELSCVHRAAEAAMAEIRSGRMATHSLKDLEKQHRM